MTTTLQVTGLGVALPRRGRMVPVLDALDLCIEPAEMLALVGESGSGKTMAALAIARLLPPGAVLSGEVRLGARSLTALAETEMRGIRGRAIGMVFQNPLASLNPSRTIGTQIAEPIRIHERASLRAARARALDLLAEVGIPDPAARIDNYPHQFSGGMRQRVMIAAALACGPALLIADEPSTGLDPALAGQILALIDRLRRQRGMAVLFITHDLSLIASRADRVQVLYAGRTVEHGPAAAIFAHPRHPYTHALLGAVPRIGEVTLAGIAGALPEPEDRSAGCRFAPRCDDRQDDCTQAYPADLHDATTAACLYPRPTHRAAALAPATASPRPPLGDTLLTARAIRVHYRGTPAIEDVGFDLRRGECLGIVGPSGSGKSTLARAVLQMLPCQGDIALGGQSFRTLRGTALRTQRRRIQPVFQDPRESFNSRMTIAQSLAEALVLSGHRAGGRRRQIEALLDRVGLPASLASALPGALSGGQVQLAAIARALAADPAVIVFDEPTSSLDVSTQATLLTLLRDLLDRRGLAYLFISHDAAVVGFLAHRVLALHAGRMQPDQPPNTTRDMIRPG